jgi:hypothetical protein
MSAERNGALRINAERYGMIRGGGRCLASCAAGVGRLTGGHGREPALADMAAPIDHAPSVRVCLFTVTRRRGWHRDRDVGPAPGGGLRGCASRVGGPVRRGLRDERSVWGRPLRAVAERRAVRWVMRPRARTCRCGWGCWVDFAVGQAGAVIDSGVDVVEPDGSPAVGAGGTAVGPPAAAIRDPAEFLDVDVDEFTRADRVHNGG